MRETQQALLRTLPDRAEDQSSSVQACATSIQHHSLGLPYFAIKTIYRGKARAANSRTVDTSDQLTSSSLADKDHRVQDRQMRSG